MLKSNDKQFTMRNMKKNRLKNWVLYRGLDMLPGIFTWVSFLGILAGGYYVPAITAYVIICFNVFWVIKAFGYFRHFFISYFFWRAWQIINWEDALKNLRSKEEILSFLNEEYKRCKECSLQEYYDNNHIIPSFWKLPYWLESIFLAIQRVVTIGTLKKEAERLLVTPDEEIIYNVDNLTHFVIFPFATEPFSVLNRSVKKLSEQTFNKKQIVLVLGAEEACPTGREVGARIMKAYQGIFKDVIMTHHELKPDEIRGKAANMWYAATQVDKYVKERKINKEMITITSCDCDSQFPPEYFTVLTYQFCTSPEKYTVYWNGGMTFYANVWKLPFYLRVVSTTTSIGSFTKLSDKGLIQVSTYSASYKLVESIGFWTKTIIPEDWNMFFKAVFKYGKRVKTIPLYLRIMSDSPEGSGHVNSFVNQYEQIKRWAWGVSDIPWVIRSIFSMGKLKFNDRIYVLKRAFICVRDHQLWPLYAFVLAFGANIPPLFNKSFSATSFGVLLPKVSSLILSFSSIMGFVLLLVDATMKPKPIQKYNFGGHVLYLLQFVISPVVGILFGSLPALDSHTRLLIGKRLEYRVTEKK